MDTVITVKPGSKTKIVICMGSSCFARGNAKSLEAVEAFLKKHELGAEVELSGSLCEGNCGKGPNIAIGGKLFSVGEKNLEKILERELLG